MRDRLPEPGHEWLSIVYDISMRCERCPVDPLCCPGESASRLCDLIDPASALYRPGYARSIIEASRQPSQLDIAAIIAENKAAAKAYQGQPGQRGGCCP